MNDNERLADRLRKMATAAGKYDLGDYWNVCDEAADEIDRLRKLLDEHLASEAAETMRADRLQAEVKALRAKLDAYASAAADFNEALNRGDGAFRP
jgi:hypothetical protein